MMAPFKADNYTVKDTKEDNQDSVLPNSDIPAVTLVSSRTLITASKIVSENKCKSETLPSMWTHSSDEVPQANKESRSPDAESYTSSCDTNSSDDDALAVKPAILPQIGGTLIIAFTYLGFGTFLGFTGATLIQMTDPQSDDLYLNPTQAALFTSLNYLGMAFGCTCSGALQVKLGQRVTLLTVIPLSMAAWLTMAFVPVDAVWLIQIARAVQGVVVGVIYVTSSNYVVEVAHSDYRGRLGGTLAITRQVGIMFVYLLSLTNLSWREIALLCGCVSNIPPFLGLLFLPNSPRWLASRGCLEEAHKALTFYHGSQYDSQTELTKMSEQFSSSGKGNSFMDQMKMMKDRRVLRCVFFMSFFVFARQFLGNTVVVSNMSSIFHAADVKLDKYISTVVSGAIRVSGTFVYLCISDHVGRRPALITSLLMCFPCLLSLGVFFFMKTNGMDVQYLDWLPLTAVGIFNFFISIAVPVINILPGELMPTFVRSVTTALLCTVTCGASFLSNFTFKHFHELLYTWFWIYACVCVLLALIAFFNI
ncbi:unnamed protein product, partial [Meganyctiphanes norvegica]